MARVAEAQVPTEDACGPAHVRRGVAADTAIAWNPRRRRTTWAGAATCACEWVRWPSRRRWPGLATAVVRSGSGGGALAALDKRAPLSPPFPFYNINLFTTFLLNSHRSSVSSIQTNSVYLIEASSSSSSLCLGALVMVALLTVRVVQTSPVAARRHLSIARALRVLSLVPLVMLICSRQLPGLVALIGLILMRRCAPAVLRCQPLRTCPT